MKLLAFACDGNYFQAFNPKNNISEVVQTGIYSDYYVSTDGNDNNSGLSPELAWKTIAKVNVHSFVPGDRIFFKRGDQWSEQLTISQSGTEKDRIIFSAYGTGHKPIINGADLTTGWGHCYRQYANIYGTVNTNATTTRAMVVIDGVIYSEVMTLAALTSANKYWINTASTPDSLYIYSTTDPDALKAEVSKRDYGIYLPAINTIEYVNFTYLEIRYAGTSGLDLNGPGGHCIVDSCSFYANRLWGPVVHYGHNNDIFKNSTSTYNGNGFYSWVSDNLTISNCSSSHNIKYVVAPGTTDGHGYGLYDSDDCIVEHCESNDDVSGIVIDANSNANGAIIRYNDIHDSKTGTTGISVSRLGAGATISVYYNLIVNCGGATGSGSSFDSWIANAGPVLVYNNTMYNNSSNGGNNTVMLNYGDNVVLKNNIIVSEIGNWKSPYFVNHANLATSDYNQFYSTGVDTNWFSYNGTAYSSLANWQAGVSQDANSQSGDPLFVNKTSDWTLQAGSPCINKGVDVGLKQDLLGNPIVGLPDIGAFEKQISSYTPTPLYLSSVIQNSSPSSLEMTYDLSLSNIVPASTAFSVRVNSVTRTVNAVTVSGTKVQLTLASHIVYGDVVILTYTKPSSNPLQTAAGGIAASISNQPVINNCINIAPSVAITSPIMNSSFTALANITITANALDNDGSVSLVEFYNSSTKLGSKAVAPYSFTWNNVPAGIYSLTAVATDNLNAKTISSAISISVINGTTTENQPPVVEIYNPLKGNKYEMNSTITVDAVASDPYGSISKVEFYSGAVKLIELTSAPYTYIWKDVSAGSYSITAVATDNLNATTTSSPIEFEVGTTIKYDANSEIINLYPNPNDGHFRIDLIIPLLNEKSQIIITDLAGKQIYHEPILKEETSKQFDLSYIKSGIYIMMIICKEILVTKKFIKN